MSNQIVKSLAIISLVVGLALFATAKSASGQSSSRAVTADIPFDFIVGDKTLPSGKYMVSPATSDGQGLKIINSTGKGAAFRLANSVTHKNDNRGARMVFHRYGDQYFLAQVWSGDEYGRELLPSKRERNLRLELASNRSKTDSANGSYKIVEVVALVR